MVTNEEIIRTTSSASNSELTKWIFNKERFLEPLKEGLISYFLKVLNV